MSQPNGQTVCQEPKNSSSRLGRREMLRASLTLDTRRASPAPQLMGAGLFWGVTYFLLRSDTPPLFLIARRVWSEAHPAHASQNSALSFRLRDAMTSVSWRRFVGVCKPRSTSPPDALRTSLRAKDEPSERRSCMLLSTKDKTTSVTNANRRTDRGDRLRRQWRLR